MRGHAPISPIYRLGDARPARSPEEQFAIEYRLRRDLWQQCGVIACRVTELPEDLRQQVEAWAKAEFGGRR